MAECMKIEIAASMLNAALKTLRPVIERCTTIPILGSVKLADGRLTVTDLDRELSVSVAALEFSGEGCLAFWPLFRLAGALSRSFAETLCNDDRLTIRMDQGEKFAVIASRFGRYRIPVFPASDFPHLSMPEDGQRIEVDGEALKRALAFAAPFASRDETRYYLNGVCLFGRAVVATDGHRLAFTDNVNAHAFDNLIIPNAAVRVLLAMPPVDSLVLGHTRFSVEVAGLRLVAKTIDGAFPDVRRVIPQCEQTSRVERAALAGSVRRLSMLQGSGIPYISMVLDGDRIALAASGLDGEGGEELIEASGDAFAADFNGRYLADVLRAIGGESVTIARTSSEDVSVPTIFRGDVDGEDRFVVLMPTRTKDTLAVARAALATLDARKAA